MAHTHRNDERTAELAKIAETEHDIALLRQHVKEVVEGAAFKGSHRSGQFLQYIVEQAIAGHFESLKERVIGVELFNRAPTYDTGEDAIVRVTASDVRKRLLQHYGRYGAANEFRISLPLGSYIPEVTRDLPLEAPAAPPVVTPIDLVPVPSVPENVTLPIEPASALHESSVVPENGRKRRWIAAVLMILFLNCAVWAGVWNHFAHKNVADFVLPWSALFNSPRPLQIITSDPDIAEVQGLTGQTLSLSDYANHNYIPHPEALTPEISRVSQILLRGNKASLVDTPIAVSIAQLAQGIAKKVEVHPARSVQLANLQTDDSLVLLGSPRSNPWVTFFSDPLNFRFGYNQDTRQEIILNLHPRTGEQPQYVPTALGWATGQSYAIVALVRNPDQNGKVLILAGANAEGTEAAGKLVSDLPRLSAALSGCGVSPQASPQYFELLLRLNMMAGSPTNISVEACRILSNGSSH